MSRVYSIDGNTVMRTCDVKPYEPNGKRATDRVSGQQVCAFETRRRLLAFLEPILSPLVRKNRPISRDRGRGAGKEYLALPMKGMQ